jgi:hypothetical protein
MTAGAPWACRRDPVWGAATSGRQSGTVLDGQPCRFPRCRILRLDHLSCGSSSIYDQLRSLMLTSLFHCLATVPEAFRVSSHFFLLAETNRSGTRILQGVPMDHVGKLV